MGKIYTPLIRPRSVHVAISRDRWRHEERKQHVVVARNRRGNVIELIIEGQS
jgi:hypothetical protein